MAKRTSQEARTVFWFETVPKPAMEVLFGIVQAVVKRRRTEDAPTTQPGTKVITRRPRKKREAPGLSQQGQGNTSSSRVEETLLSKG